MTCLVLLALANVCLLVPDHRQEEAFLAGLGLSHMKDVFREQEVRVEMIPHLDNATLSSLGFATIGARFNARASARAFVYVEQEEQGQEEQEHLHHLHHYHLLPQHQHQLQPEHTAADSR